MKEKTGKPKSIVGVVKNKKFAYFWILIGGSIGNLIITFYSFDVWPIFLPPAILSILLMAIVADGKRRPRIWLAGDLVLTTALLLSLIPFAGEASPGIFLPGALIIFGCILGVMNW